MNATLSNIHVNKLAKYNYKYIDSNGDVYIGTKEGRLALVPKTTVINNTTIVETNTGVTDVTATSPITSSGGTTPDISTSMNTNKLIGRSSTGVGVMEEITIGTNLTLSSGVLNATGGSGSSPLTTKGDIYVRNASTDTRLPVGLNTQILIADSSTATGLKWGSNAAPTALGYYGAWQDNQTQTAAASNTGYAMIFRTIDLSNGVSVVSNGTNLTRITFANTGIYNLQFSSQFQNTDNAQHDVTIWLRRNGIDLAGTSGFISVPARKSAGVGNEGHLITGWNYVLSIVGGEYYEIVWSTSNHTHVTMQFYAAGSPPPSTASVIMTVTQQSGIMAGTGLTAINSLTGAVQTIVAGTSGTDFAVSSSGTAHTLNLPTASATNRGALSSADWTTFNNKQNALGFTPVAANSAITGATKTKITYDSKGLVTVGADATTADITDSTNKRYVTDAQLVVIGNTSGTNTGDQTLAGLGGVATTRTLSTTAPLSGGGDLSANRTLSIADAVADGSTKGAAAFTTADFNSASGVISIDYTNGQSASSSNKGFLTSTDWTIFNSKPNYLTANNWNLGVQGGGTLATISLGPNVIKFYKIYITNSVTVTRLGCNVTTAGTAGSRGRLGIYSDVNGYPSTLILDSGEFTADVIAPKLLTGLSASLPAGVAWLCSVHNSASNVAFNSHPVSNLYPLGSLAPGGGLNANLTHYSGTFTYGALPANTSALTLSLLTTSVPAVYFYA